MDHMFASGKDKYTTFDSEDPSSLDGDVKIVINEDKGISSVIPEPTKSESDSNQEGTFFNKIKGILKFGSSETESMTNTEMTWKDKLIEKLKNTIEIEKSYKTFFILLGIGIGILCLSLFFLVFSPLKFISLFNLGSLIIIASFLFIYGTESYLKKLFSKERFGFTILYFSSIIIGFIFSFINGWFIVSLLCALAQLITLIIFVLSFIPGGRAGISLITNMLKSPFASMWMKMKGQSYLPQ